MIKMPLENLILLTQKNVFKRLTERMKKYEYTYDTPCIDLLISNKSFYKIINNKHVFKFFVLIQRLDKAWLITLLYEFSQDKLSEYLVQKINHEQFKKIQENLELYKKL